MSEGIKGMSQSWKKSYDVTIQMNLLPQYFHIFVFQYFYHMKSRTFSGNILVLQVIMIF